MCVCVFSSLVRGEERFPSAAFVVVSLVYKLLSTNLAFNIDDSDLEKVVINKKDKHANRDLNHCDEESFVSFSFRFKKIAFLSRH